MAMKSYPTNKRFKFSKTQKEELFQRIKNVHEQFPLRGKPTFKVDPEKCKPVPKWW